MLVHAAADGAMLQDAHCASFLSGKQLPAASACSACATYFGTAFNLQQGLTNVLKRPITTCAWIVQKPTAQLLSVALLQESSSKFARPVCGMYMRKDMTPNIVLFTQSPVSEAY